MTPYYDREKWPGFLAAIRAAPDDDLPRLVAADFLEENGEPERAEFVRVQCDLGKTDGGEPDCNRYANRMGCECDECERWYKHMRLEIRERELWNKYHVDWLIPVAGSRQCSPSGDASAGVCGMVWGTEVHVDQEFSRGFVSRVRAPLAGLCGGECGGGCEGTGKWAEWGMSRDCPACHGTGRTPGVLRELLRREPLTAESVEVSDRDPQPEGIPKEGIGWIRDGSSVNLEGRLDVIPTDVYDLLDGGSEQWDSVQWTKYPAESAAHLALSRAVYAMCSPESEVTT